MDEWGWERTYNPSRLRLRNGMKLLFMSFTKSHRLSFTDGELLRGERQMFSLTEQRWEALEIYDVPKQIRP